MPIVVIDEKMSPARMREDTLYTDANNYAILREIMKFETYLKPSSRDKKLLMPDFFHADIMQVVEDWCPLAEGLWSGEESPGLSGHGPASAPGVTFEDGCRMEKEFYKLVYEHLKAKFLEIKTEHDKDLVSFEKKQEESEEKNEEKNEEEEDEKEEKEEKNEETEKEEKNARLFKVIWRLGRTVDYLREFQYPKGEKPERIRTPRQRLQWYGLEVDQFYTCRMDAIVEPASAMTTVDNNKPVENFERRCSRAIHNSLWAISLGDISPATYHLPDGLSKEEWLHLIDMFEMDAAIRKRGGPVREGVDETMAHDETVKSGDETMAHDEAVESDDETATAEYNTDGWEYVNMNTSA
ncbi:hypothetical protein CYMTET_47765 [Cymbomonas tetramitiformis]|uniref:Uncharacterized protein n=1 Tax=Cymbomonas tetramitiformis TaxID=36881 RepID=A0AAE0BTN4_9CHLO|nr:hypothetical protein CYMTET_47765 [Cymbomonas tetramitiformis]|eukprot:gene3241-4089_t